MRISKAKFRIAVQELIDRGLAPQEKAMLRAHWAAPARTVSMTQLAEAAGYPRFHYANIRYGNLAYRIMNFGGIDLPSRWIALNAVATWSGDSRNPRGHFAFTMRPELAAVLEELGLVDGAEAPNEGNGPFEAIEGEEYEAVVRHRKREAKLRQAKLAEAIAASSDGRVRCQVPGCNFDFEATYGSTGAGYAQVHHAKPLSSRVVPEKTRLADLVVVCANCHAMIHRFGASRPVDGLIPGSVQSNERCS